MFEPISGLLEVATKNNYIIKRNQARILLEAMENQLHGSLKDGRGIAEPER